VQQVITNLLTSAAQYRAGSTAVTLVVAGATDVVRISVNNLGTAIPAAELQTIFNAMVQLPQDEDLAGRPSTSLGLGLFIAREIALAHGGSIDVASNDPDGTTFAVAIPRKPEPLKLAD
jgi:signal transduction histidine kinase